ncbi:pro-resilin-like [Sitophilus oryzae]|uniref:Pro-resilin-like n=1 Tax=Sitophilus oryzae TaxID=7048 RepID=A0A6J2YJT0_SITOR|nr:pro-resilin-like [Sitophilus oryzae]
MAAMTYTVVLAIALIVLVEYSYALPQFPQRRIPGSSDENYPPQPYEFEYKVDNSPSSTFFGQTESGDAQGRVVGNYYVLLADGRLMNVEYSVDGESGFVPRITFSPQGAPVTSAPRLG